MSNNSDKNQYFWNFTFSVLYLLLALIAASLLGELDRLPVRISLFDFSLLILATFRLTHLFVYDSVMNFLREYFAKFNIGPGKTISNLISCPWCTGMWMALIVSFFYFLTPYAWFVIFVIALAGAAIALKIILDRIERQ